MYTYEILKEFNILKNDMDHIKLKKRLNIHRQPRRKRAQCYVWDIFVHATLGAAKRNVIGGNIQKKKKSSCLWGFNSFFLSAANLSYVFSKYEIFVLKVDHIHSKCGLPANVQGLQQK